MEHYYAARAAEYDTVYLKPERQSDLRAMEQWVAQRFAGASVLELACGTGYWTQFIARSAKRICALDAVAETVEIAKHRISTRNVEFVIGDAYAPPRARRGFDAAAPESLEDTLRRVIREELAAAAERAQPQAPSRAHALNCKCGVCKPRVKGS